MYLLVLFVSTCILNHGLNVDVGDRPLVVQFAARNGKEFADAAELVAPFADAVDLNCGCPQR